MLATVKTVARASMSNVRLVKVALSTGLKAGPEVPVQTPMMLW